MSLIRNILIVMINKRNTLSIGLLIFVLLMFVQQSRFGIHSSPLEDIALTFRLRQTLFTQTVIPVRNSKTKQNDTRKIVDQNVAKDITHVEQHFGEKISEQNFAEKLEQNNFAEKTKQNVTVKIMKQNVPDKILNSTDKIIKQNMTGKIIKQKFAEKTIKQNVPVKIIKQNVPEKIGDQNITDKILKNETHRIIVKHANIFKPPDDIKISEKEYYKLKLTKVNPHDFMVMKRPIGCETSQPFLLILVLSTPQNLDRRAAIRETWGKAALNGSWPNRPQDGNFVVRVYFLLGKPSSENKTLGTLLENEASVYKDILQEDFIDTYANLPKKTIMGLKWASRECKSAKFIMKTDDDTFVNLGPLVTFIKHNQDVKSKVIGVFCPRSVVIRSGRWGVTKEEYPFSRYPPYTAGGPGYVLPAHLASALYNISQFVPEIKLEDVYVTGILTKASQTIKPGSARGFHDSSRKFINVCGFVTSSPILAVPQLTPDKIRKFWDFIVKHKHC